MIREVPRTKEEKKRERENEGNMAEMSCVTMSFDAKSFVSFIFVVPLY
jgi:hypothetical protein